MIFQAGTPCILAMARLKRVRIESPQKEIPVLRDSFTFDVFIPEPLR